MFIYEILKSIVLGIIQGITEWLPVSSTGHLILANEFLNLSFSSDFLDLFEVVIQLGSILAVVVLYFGKLNPFSPKKSTEEKKDTWSLWFKVLVAIIPVGIVGFLLDDYTDRFYIPTVVAAALIIYGILFIVMESRRNTSSVNSIKELSYKKALYIGFAQILSLVPGTSRSGSTILGAVFVGCSRTVAAEFSFFMAIPVMFGASLLKLVKFGFDFSMEELIVLIVGTAVSFIVSIFAIKFLMNYIKKHNFKVFGWYRIILGIAVLLYFLIKTIK